MKLKKFRLVGINALILLNIFLPINASSNEYIENISRTENIIDPNYIRNIPSVDDYIIGSGDKIKLKVYSGDVGAINETFFIDGEGLANLSRLKKIFISGLTIKELTNILNKEYEKFVKNPQVVLEIISYRPIRVYIDGEVQDPGMHVLPGSSSPLSDIENFQESNQNIANNDLNQNNIYFPSVFDLIRKSNGISIYADLTNVEVTRVNSLSRGGGRIKTNINLLKTLDLEDISQNIRLFDGDTVLINKAKKPVTAQISKAIKSNLNPKFIDVFLQGSVTSPGVVKVTKNSTLNEAIVIGGGTKVLKGPVVFLRYKNDGSVERRKFAFKGSASRGSYRNPFLLEGDLIFVGKSRLTATNEVLGEVTAPFQGIFSTWGFFKILFN